MSSSQKTFQSHTKFTANEYRSYGHTRREIYGQDVDTRDQKHPSAAAERDYYTYSEFKEQSNASVSHYNKTYEKVSGEPYERAHGPGSKFHLLQQQQHQELVSPAAQAATDTNLHASTRNAFLDIHPFAYQNMEKRMKHEQLADKATEQANHYRQLYDTHYEKAGVPTRPIKQAPYGSYGTSSAATTSLQHQRPVAPVPPPQRPGNPRIPSPSEAYGQVGYSAQGSATTATSSTYRQPRSGYASLSPSTHDKSVLTASEAYGQASYSTRSSARVTIPTSYSQMPSGSLPPPGRLYDPRVPSPEQAYGNTRSGRR